MANIEVIENFNFNGYSVPVIKSSQINSLREYQTTNSINITESGITIFNPVLTFTTRSIMTNCINEVKAIPLDTPIGTNIVQETYVDTLGSLTVTVLHEVLVAYTSTARTQYWFRSRYQYTYGGNILLNVEYRDFYNVSDKSFASSRFYCNYGSGNLGGMLIKFEDGGKNYYGMCQCYWVYRTDTEAVPIEYSRRISGPFGFDNAITEDDLKNIGNITPPYVPQPDNPYDPVNPSEPGGGGGTFDDTSDEIPDSTLPTLSSANTGFTRIYNPTLSQVQALANYLWTDESVITTIWNHIKQYFEDPMQAIIGFNLVPVPVPDGGVEEFKLMYIGTGVNMTVAASQFVDVDCGTFTLEKYYGSALDYSPYTKVSCFLPFIGNVDLNPDEIMGTTLQITYRVDICSGSCVAKILVDGNCLYQYSGHCAIPIPISSSDFSSYVSSAVSVAKLAIGAAVAGAAGAATAGAVEAGQATGQLVEASQVDTTGQFLTPSTQNVQPTSQPQTQTKASFAGLSPTNISNTVGEIMSSKPIFQHSGSFSGNTGYLGVRRPYLIITRPNLCMPANYQALNGYPSMMTLKLGDCSGYTRVQQVQLTGMWATNPEQAEILQLLKSGVIL